MAEFTPEEIIATQIRVRLEAEKKELTSPCLRATCPLPRDTNTHNEHIMYARDRVKAAKKKGKIEEAYLIHLAEEDTPEEARWKRLKNDESPAKYERRIVDFEEKKRQQMEPAPKPTFWQRVGNTFSDLIEALWT